MCAVCPYRFVSAAGRKSQLDIFISRILKSTCINLPPSTCAVAIDLITTRVKHKSVTAMAANTGLNHGRCTPPIVRRWQIAFNNIIQWVQILSHCYDYCSSCRRADFGDANLLLWWHRKSRNWVDVSLVTLLLWRVCEAHAHELRVLTSRRRWFNTS